MVVWDDQTKKLGKRSISAGIPPHASTHEYGGSDLVRNLDYLAIRGNTVISSDRRIVGITSLSQHLNPDQDNVRALGSGDNRYAGVVAVNGYFDNLYSTSGSIPNFPSGINIGADVKLYRSAADVLATDDNLAFLSGQPYIRFLNTQNSTNRYIYNWTNRMAITFPDPDCDGLWIEDAIGSDKLRFSRTGVITFSPDVNLYRSGVDVLKTDDNFVVGNQWLNIDPPSGTPILDLNVGGVTKGFLAFDGTQVALTSTEHLTLTAGSGKEVTVNPLTDSQASETGLSINAHTLTDLLTVSRTLAVAKKALINAHAYIYTLDYSPDSTWECNILVDGSQPTGAYQRQCEAGNITSVYLSCIVNLAAGSHTIKLQGWSTYAGTVYSRRLDVLYL